MGTWCCRQVTTLLIGLVLMVSPAIASVGNDQQLPPRDAVRALGVGHYSAMVPTWDGAAVILVDETKQQFAAVMTTRSFDGTRVFRIDRPQSGEHLIAYWKEGHFEFDAGDGVIHTIAIDPDSGARLGDERSLALFSRHEASLTLAVAVGDDLISRLPRRAIKPMMPMEPESWGGPVDWTTDMWVTYWYPWFDYLGGGYVQRQVGCVGPTVRGTAVGDVTRSAICAAARADANLQCWNTYCIGCCQMDSCDAFCLLGDDYLCLMAGVTGRSCGLY